MGGWEGVAWEGVAWEGVAWEGAAPYHESVELRARAGAGLPEAFVGRAPPQQPPLS